MSAERIAKLVARFDGLIKYAPMLQDHPDWADDQCIAFAQEMHAVALIQYEGNPATWNSGIPYCRNVFRPEKA
jgi:hypothetical protein